MKKVWQLIFALFILTIPARADIVDRVQMDAWIDSIYQKLTVEERIGQLIDLRIEPTGKNYAQIIDIIEKNHIGSVT